MNRRHGESSKSPLALVYLKVRRISSLILKRLRLAFGSNYDVIETFHRLSPLLPSNPMNSRLSSVC